MNEPLTHMFNIIIHKCHSILIENKDQQNSEILIFGRWGLFLKINIFSLLIQYCTFLQEALEIFNK